MLEEQVRLAASWRAGPAQHEEARLFLFNFVQLSSMNPRLQHEGKDFPPARASRPPTLGQDHLDQPFSPQPSGPASPKSQPQTSQWRPECFCVQLL